MLLDAMRNASISKGCAKKIGYEYLGWYPDSIDEE
jgi:hypothetical protein